MDILLTDIRSAWRGLRSSPGTSVLAFVILASTIAAGTVTFSVVDAVAIRRLPFASPDRLVAVGRASVTVPGQMSPVSPQDYYNWLDRTSVFGSLGAARPGRSLRVRIGETVSPVVTGWVTVNLFETLGVHAQIGRLFDATDATPTSAATVMTDAYWRTAFNADPGIVGSRLPLEDGAREVIGVLPAGAEFPVSTSAQLFVPYVPSESDRSPASPGRTFWMSVVGRLRPGQTVGNARADLERASAAMTTAFPDAPEGSSRLMVMSLQDATTGPAKSWLYLALAAVGIVLLIAIINVANLFLARSAVRIRDIATRLALGASPSRLTRVLLLEGAILSLAAGAAGTGVSWWGIGVAKAALPATVTRTASIALDVRVLAVSLGASLCCGLLFASAPAWLSRRETLTVLTRAGNAGSLGGRRRLRTLKTLLTAEMAFVTTLLVASTLLITSFIRVSTVDLGFDRHDVVTASFYKDLRSVPPAGQTAATTAILVDVLARAERIPGVKKAAILQNGMPLSGSSVRYSINIPGRGDTKTDMLEKRDVTNGYFDTMGLTLVAGRLFRESDGRGAPRVAVLNEMAAEHYFGTRDAVGKTFGFRGPTTVVGIVRGVRLSGPEGDIRPEMYLPIAQSEDGVPFASGTVVLRVKSRTPAVLNALAAVVATANDPGMSSTPKFLNDDFRRLTADRRFNAGVMAIYGVLAIAIGALGIYGTMAFLVAQRVREIGVRMALGASPARVMRTVFSDAGWCVLIGLTAGLAAARAVSGLFTSLVFGVTATSPLVYAAVGLILTFVALAASLVPARRASRLDPLQALRVE